ncbi:MAG TPA: trypsin-like serine protease [Pyrinomonadaceae bacterium]|jgi:secreted trypsin-like serine protease|nr:trypsin-like serine protease [Pyrinomonadaceae bacterium]
MKRVICFVALTLSLICGSLLLAPKTSAITYGFVDSNNTFRNTGAFIVKSSSTGEIFPICSGTLITPNVFLTASHCTIFYQQELAAEGYVAYVSLDASIPFGALTTSKTKLLAVSHVVTNPNYNQSQSDPGDIGALILDRNVTGVTPATLPACGLLDQLVAQNGLKTAVFTNVGYGVQNRIVSGGVPFFQDLNPVPRMFSFSSFNSLNGGYLRLSQNATTGNGGTCFGDSGGPQFFTVNGQQLIISITITGDSVCRSTNVDYRLDTLSAQGFLAYVNAAFGTSIPISC